MKPILPSINDIDFKQLNTNDMPMPGPELMDAFIRDLKNMRVGALSRRPQGQITSLSGILLQKI